MKRLYNHQKFDRPKFLERDYIVDLAGDIFDLLFNTYEELRVEDIKYGLEEFDNTERQTFWYLLKVLL